MDYQSHTVKITVKDQNAKLDKILSDVNYLPQWTKFFKRIIKKENESHLIDTVLGLASTHIERISNEQTCLYIIHSQFSDRHEQAEIKCSKNREMVLIEFTIHLPMTLSKEQIDNQLTQLHLELHHIKLLIEDNHE